MQQRPDRIEPRRRRAARAPSETPRPIRQLDVAPRQFGVKQQGQAAEQQIAQGEGEGAEGDEHADFGHAEPLGRIGAIAHDGAGEDGGADVVRERVGGEGDQPDEAPAQPAPEMGERDLVVPGQGGIGEARSRRSPAPNAAAKWRANAAPTSAIDRPRSSLNNSQDVNATAPSPIDRPQDVHHPFHCSFRARRPPRRSPSLHEASGRRKRGAARDTLDARVERRPAGAGPRTPPSGASRWLYDDAPLAPPRSSQTFGSSCAWRLMKR